MGGVMDEQAELRKRFKAWSKAQREGRRPPIDPAFQDLRCGAKTRAGTPCKRRDLWDSGRCKLHGGMSTGPKTGPRAKKPVPELPEEPYDPAKDPEMVEIMNKHLKRAGIRLG
tara:strand:+ start:1224 stop:1562 length:339 start_codon:yes stop_codon:yes gene_type:complete